MVCASLHSFDASAQKKIKKNKKASHFTQFFILAAVLCSDLNLQLLQNICRSCHADVWNIVNVKGRAKPWSEHLLTVKGLRKAIYYPFNPALGNGGNGWIRISINVSRVAGQSIQFYFQMPEREWTWIETSPGRSEENLEKAEIPSHHFLGVVIVGADWKLPPSCLI